MNPYGKPLSRRDIGKCRADEILYNSAAFAFLILWGMLCVAKVLTVYRIVL